LNSKEGDHMPLSQEQQRLVEENMGLVGQFINDHIHDLDKGGIFTRDDLFQIGCVGLCNAALSYDPGRQAKFDTYAYILIRNAIYTKLEYATLRKHREQAVDTDDLPVRNDDLFAEQANLSSLNDLLDKAFSVSTGVTAKGIAAIRLRAQGYSCKEIGEQFGGASANNVSAWIARARKYLLQDPSIAAMAP